MIFLVRQLQEKCKEQNKPLYSSFIDFIKAFDLVSRDSLLKTLTKIGCPRKLKSLIEFLHNNMWGTVQRDENKSNFFYSQWCQARLRYSDVCTRDVKELFVDLSKWEELTTVSREVVFKPL